MKVPLLDLKKQYAGVRDETKRMLEDILESQYFIGGPYVAKFEEAVAEYSGTKFAVGVSSGTDALLATKQLNRFVQKLTKLLFRLIHFLQPPDVSGARARGRYLRI